MTRSVTPKKHDQALIAKCRALNEETSSHSYKVHAALKYSESDRRTNTILRSEFEKACRNVEVLGAHDLKTHENLSALAQEIASQHPQSAASAAEVEVERIKTEEGNCEHNVADTAQLFNSYTAETSESDVTIAGLK
jgi:hypothetical protein